MDGRVVAVCVSDHKGERKRNVGQGMLKKGFGLLGDAHGGDWHRQVSLLALESIDVMREEGILVGPGDFAENITTEGLQLKDLSIGTRLHIGEAAIQITQIGKECHAKCEIYHQAGHCIMPVEGLFAEVIRDGVIKVGDGIEVVIPCTP